MYSVVLRFIVVLLGLASVCLLIWASVVVIRMLGMLRTFVARNGLSRFKLRRSPTVVVC